MLVSAWGYGCELHELSGWSWEPEIPNGWEPPASVRSEEDFIPFE